MNDIIEKLCWFLPFECNALILRYWFNKRFFGFKSYSMSWFPYSSSSSGVRSRVLWPTCRVQEGTRRVGAGRWNPKSRGLAPYLKEPQPPLVSWQFWRVPKKPQFVWCLLCVYRAWKEGSWKRKGKEIGARECGNQIIPQLSSPWGIKLPPLSSFPF